MRFPKDFYEHLKNHTLTGIKGGTEHVQFLEIWMVEVNGRVFARSWNQSQRSWFTAFLETGVGQIKYGGSILSIKGVKVDSKDLIHADINRAYLERYDQPENIHYAQGITQPEYTGFTMELLFVKKAS